MTKAILLAAGLALLPGAACANDADILKKALKDNDVHPSWVYNDLAAGLARAKKDNKPLLVLFR